MNEWKKLADCMARAEHGGEMTIGFLGGSITQGSLASAEDKTYAYQVYRWWCDTFPQAAFHYVNGGIGGTCSCFGVARAVRDLLMYQPDIVVVDFSVNDRGECPEEEQFYQETFEGLLRRILSWNSSPAVLVLNNVYYDSGKTMQDKHNEVARYYGVPFVSIKDSIYREMKEGKYRLNDLTPDGLHPNDRGHALVAGEIIRLFEKIRAWDGEDGPECSPCLPVPLTENAYESARLITLQNSQPELMGFLPDTREKMGHLDLMKNGWIGKKKGDKIVFRVQASCIAVQYRKTIVHPAVSARLVLDGASENAVILDGDFEETWGDCLYLQRILHHGKYGEHKLEIEVTGAEKEEEERVAEERPPFYLLGLILA